jgi:hypothetical protein
LASSGLDESGTSTQRRGSLEVLRRTRKSAAVLFLRQRNESLPFEFALQLRLIRVNEISRIRVFQLCSRITGNPLRSSRESFATASSLGSPPQRSPESHENSKAMAVGSGSIQPERVPRAARYCPGAPKKDKPGWYLPHSLRHERRSARAHYGPCINLSLRLLTSRAR